MRSCGSPRGALRPRSRDGGASPPRSIGVVGGDRLAARRSSTATILLPGRAERSFASTPPSSRRSPPTTPIEPRRRCAASRERGRSAPRGFRRSASVTAAVQELVPSERARELLGRLRHAHPRRTGRDRTSHRRRFARAAVRRARLAGFVLKSHYGSTAERRRGRPGDRPGGCARSARSPSTAPSAA